MMKIACVDESRFFSAMFTIFLGVWLVATQIILEKNSAFLLLSDLLSAGAAILFAVLFLLTKKKLWGWAISPVGQWLQLAPLLFWAKSPLTYFVDTTVGALLVIFSFRIGSLEQKTPLVGAEIPKGWSFNPSSWPARWLVVGLAFLCLLFSRYLAMYQLGYIDQMWDPVFQNGSLNVITSQISRDFPVSDAGLGAFSYTMEFLLGWQGSSQRWRTMPWLVLSFGFCIVPSSLISILLIILQPSVVGAWCFWCLLTAVLMLFMILLGGSEMIASIELLRHGVREGKGFWKVLLQGYDLFEPKEQSPSSKKLFRGFSCPWNLCLLIFLGLGLMMSPYLAHFEGFLATVSYIIGPLVISLCVLSMVEVYRAARFLVGFLGLFLLGAVLFQPDPSFFINGVLVVFAFLMLTLFYPRGAIHEKYGSWERFIV